jgi:hypothetical protein
MRASGVQLETFIRRWNLLVLVPLTEQLVYASLRQLNMEDPYMFMDATIDPAPSVRS